MCPIRGITDPKLIEKKEDRSEGLDITQAESDGKGEGGNDVSWLQGRTLIIK